MAIFKNTPPVVTNGLLVYLDVANPTSYVSGSSIWRNVIPTSPYSSSLQGPTQYSTLNGGSIIFNSISYASTNYIAPSPSLTSSTYEVAFRPVATINDFSGLIGYSGYLTDGFSLGMFPNYIVSQGFSGSTAFYDSFNINPSSSVVVTAVFGNRTNTYYVNGTFVARTTYAFDLPSSPVGVRIGNQTQGGWSNGNTHLFNVKIYNRALTANEVTQNYNATKVRFNLT